jgi:ribosomal protein S14
MEIKVTKEEIFNNPNDYELGRLVRRKYWEEHEKQIMENPDEHVGLVIAEDGSVRRVVRPHEMSQTCSICGEPTYMISTEHLIGYNHMECVLRQDNEYDTCVVCGRETSYKRTTPIDLRVGYIEGAGQTCDGTCRKG